jgi:hypothetical protein
MLLLLAAGCHRGQEAVAPPPPEEPSFNERVVALIDEYPAGGHGGYVWPSEEGTAGTTRDLALGGEVIARAGAGNHCVGVTLEVFWRALDGCPGGAEGAFAPAEARAFKELWYVPELGGRGAADALPAHHLGGLVALDEARPGDFVQAWATSGQGHSMVFLGWDRDDAGTITGIRYWSSQPWTEGIGVSEMAIDDTGAGFDPAQVYVARAACP